MLRFIGRSCLAFGLLMSLSACQNLTQNNQEPTVDEFAVAELVFNTHLNAQELDSAGQQLDDLRKNNQDEPRLDVLQQRLANAWLDKGEQALKVADMDTASAALMQAKRLLPQAPALTEGLSTALAGVQKPPAEPVVFVQRPEAPKKPVLKKPAVVSQPLPKKSIEHLESVEKTLLKSAAPGALKARILDVNATQTVVPMPMLATRNNHQLGRLLDAVAADVVKFRAAVIIEVANTRDFHWVAALLSARVKKLDANFKPRLQEVIRSDQPAQLIITPTQTF